MGPYIVGETIGRGGMGVVLAATDRRLDRRVAIKILASELAKSDELTERFDREARSVAAISHPNIVELFDVGSYDGLPYAVMEYLDGELLSDRLKRADFSADETRDLGAQIADALAKAHEADVIHRDLKPQNVMLVPRVGGESLENPGQVGTLVKLFDFGLSRSPRNLSSQRQHDTVEGVILGTPGYMAPEQALGKPATAAADIFALGCILFEAFYRKRAFAGTTKIERHQATLTAHPDPDPLRRRDDIDLAMLIDQCLAKDPADRPESAALIANRLRNRGTAAQALSEIIESGESAGRFTRRRLLELTAGGVSGAADCHILGSEKPQQACPHSIDRCLVVRGRPDCHCGDATGSGAAPGPIGLAPLSTGEELSALLVHELAQLPSIMVPPFRPLVANSPSEYRQVGELLEVNALLNGRIRTERQGTKDFLSLDLMIVSATDGTELWGDIIRTEAGDDFLQKSRFASQIASRIGHRLTSTASDDAPPTPESFHCLVDGKVRCDPDSTAGLEMALACFTKAHQADPRFAAPLAGIALTSIILAAQSNATVSVELVRQASTKATEALARSPNSIDARLATAMLDWQRVEHYAQADQKFQELLKEAPNNWQIHHQYGLLQLAIGRMEQGKESLRAASLRNPLSVTVKTDLARAHWYAGNPERALSEAQRIRKKFDDHPLAVGLQIDVYEQQQQYSEAANADGVFEAATLESYMEQRQDRLLDIPYGPFGAELNSAIWKARTRDGIDDAMIADLADSPIPPMLPLVVARHPSFQPASELASVREMLQRLEQAR